GFAALAGIRSGPGPDTGGGPVVTPVPGHRRLSCRAADGSVAVRCSAAGQEDIAAARPVPARA
ncbi:hypothetical protein B7767_12420, partial [Streptomyces sp. 13-12-16]|uniref:hypothetical protein n=1 Tax=Streptomyces sp. 13-12-16 TaxID=1570823 RepID=UPI000A229005